MVLLFSILHQQFWNAKSSRGIDEVLSFARDPEIQASYTRILQTTGINWYSGHICAEYWSRAYRENASSDVPDIPVPASQLVTLEKKLKQVHGKKAKHSPYGKRKLCGNFLTFTCVLPTENPTFAVRFRIGESQYSFHYSVVFLCGNCR